MPKAAPAPKKGCLRAAALLKSRLVREALQRFPVYNFQSLRINVDAVTKPAGELGAEHKEREPLISRHQSGDRTGPYIVALFSGKGGVGQSMLCANLGVYLAQTGRRVLLVDARRWGKNLHSFLGIPAPTLTLDMEREGVETRLEELIVPTPFAELKLLAGVRETGASAQSMECPYLVSALRRAPYDLILLDLPSHPSFLLFDHVLWADAAVLVAVPEPTAIERTWEVLRGLYFRLFKTLEQRLGIDELVEKAWLNAKDLGLKSPKDLSAAIHFFKPEAGDRLRAELKRFRLNLIINDVRTNAEAELGGGLVSAYQRYFGLQMVNLGIVENDSVVPASVRQRKPLLILQKDTKATRQIQQIAHRLIAKEAKEKIDDGKA